MSVAQHDVPLLSAELAGSGARRTSLHLLCETQQQQRRCYSPRVQKQCLRRISLTFDRTRAMRFIFASRCILKVSVCSLRSLRRETFAAKTCASSRYRTLTLLLYLPLATGYKTLTHTCGVSKVRIPSSAGPTPSRVCVSIFSKLPSFRLTNGLGTALADALRAASAAACSSNTAVGIVSCCVPIRKTAASPLRRRHRRLSSTVVPYDPATPSPVDAGRNCGPSGPLAAVGADETCLMMAWI